MMAQNHHQQPAKKHKQQHSPAPKHVTSPTSQPSGSSIPPRPFVHAGMLNSLYCFLVCSQCEWFTSRLLPPAVFSPGILQRTTTQCAKRCPAESRNIPSDVQWAPMHTDFLVGVPLEVWESISRRISGCPDSMFLARIRCCAAKREGWGVRRSILFF